MLRFVEIRNAHSYMLDGSLQGPLLVTIVSNTCVLLRPCTPSPPDMVCLSTTLKYM